VGFRKSIKLASSAIAVTVFVFLFAGVAYAQEDVTPPALVAVSFEPAVIDTSNGPVRITVTVHVTDDLSGIESMTLYFVSLESVQHFILDFDVEENRKSGDPQDGFYVSTVTLPQYSAFGQWKMNTFGLTDRAGNYVTGLPSLAGTPESHWLPAYDGIRFRNGPGERSGPLFVGSKRLFLPAVSSF
jgi:hypothetical protein